MPYVKRCVSLLILLLPLVLAMSVMTACKPDLIRDLQSKDKSQSTDAGNTQKQEKNFKGNVL